MARQPDLSAVADMSQPSNFGVQGGGCSCQLTRGEAPSWMALLLLLALAVRSRRRAS
jgi:MYXO-CTERM domain-containing protein